MSDIRPGPLGVIAALLSLTTGVAPAQTPSVREQAARVARLQHRYDSVRAANLDAERRDASAAHPDTARAGPLTVLTAPGQGPIIRGGVMAAWQQMAPYFRTDSALLESQWQVIAVENERVIHDGRPHPWATGSVHAPVEVQSVALLVTQLVRGDLGRQAGKAVDEWLGQAMPMVFDSAALRGVYVRMVTAPSEVAHRCFAGELGACRVALELDTVADPATAWFGAAERALVVARQQASNGPRSVNAPTFNQCVVQHDDYSCIVYLRSVQPYTLPLPLPLSARQSAVRTALAMGGAGAYTRFLKTPGSIRERLAATAGAPLDSVVAVWRAQVIAARPPSDRVPPRSQWSTLFWVVVLASLSLRSSRWRSE